MQTNDDVDQRKLLKKAKREARKIAHDDPDRSVAAHEYVKVMDKMMKHKKAADKRRKEIKAMVLSVTVDVVVVLPSHLSKILRFEMASSNPCAAALVHHSLALTNDCSTPVPL